MSCLDGFYPCHVAYSYPKVSYYGAYHGHGHGVVYHGLSEDASVDA